MKQRAKKSYGQHFLVNELITERISESLIYADEYKNVLEIGPGQGVLTKYLLEKSYDFKAVDADRDMIHHLFNRFPEKADHFILEDCLKLNLYDLFNGEEFCIIGNFPYNISSQIVFKILKNHTLVPEMVGMFQKEMAARIVAPHGSKTYGVISVLTQALYEGTHLFDIAPDAFNPPPKVNSSVIRLVRKDETLACDYKRLRTVVKTGFSQRRKMLRNTMKSLVENPELLSEPVFTERPEQLSLQDFVDLTNMIFPEGRIVE